MSLMEPSDRAELVSRHERSLWRRAVLWGLLPALIALILLVPGFDVLVPDSASGSRVLLVLTCVPYALACVWHARYVARRLLGVVDRGLAGLRSVEDLRAYVARLPFVVSARVAAYWLGLLVWLPPWIVVLDTWSGDWFAALLMLVGANALAGALLTYLVTEYSLRELRTVVMRGADEPPRRRIRLGGRFFASFAVTTMVPLLVLTAAMVIAITNDAVGRVPPYVITFALLVVGIGLLSTVLTVRSITAPLDILRRATDEVASGRLDVEVNVDDAGEIGALQVGFNRMVAGLRDRERLRDLFGRHVGGDVAERALSDPPNLEGEVRTVTAMFVDVIGSTPLAQSSPAIDVVAKLNAFFDAVVRNVALEGGLVNQFQGDGAVCVFGAPVDQPDHAERALRCAARLARDLRALDGVTAAIGVSTGDAVAGNIGTLARYGYTVIGDPVNEASRLCDAAKEAPSRMLVAASTFEAAGMPQGWSDAGMFALKGRTAPTRAYALAG